MREKCTKYVGYTYFEVTGAVAENNSCPMGHLCENYRVSQSIKVVKIFRALPRFAVTYDSERARARLCV